MTTKKPTTDPIEIITSDEVEEGSWIDEGPQVEGGSL